MSEERRKPGRPRKDETPITVLDRRLQGGSPFGSGSFAVPLKEPKRWQIRIFTADEGREDRHYRAVHQLGWVPLEESDLAVVPEEIGYRKTDEGYIVSGKRGQHVIMKMPLADYKRLQMAKTAANNKAIGDSKRVKSDMADAAAARFGDQAGDFIYNQAVGEIRDGRETLE